MSKEEEQLSFLNETTLTDNEPIVCLGITFTNEEERRVYFREELRRKLPELKQVEGFPIGEDEDIIALSDPPYYTACPNPWINDLIEEWEKEKVTKYGRDFEENYHREPFATDISEGKNNTIYNAHSYHTKVPHKAIMRYILHYTNPGDIVYDGFCGSGMTGLASELCESKEEIQSLGYILKDKSILNEEKVPFSKIGYRRTILNDISPAATFIAHNYNKKSNKETNAEYLFDLLDKLEGDFKWLYKTFLNEEDEVKLQREIENIKSISDIENFVNRYSDLLTTANYYIWSEIYICNNCMEEITYWDANVNKDEKSVKKNLVCPHCNAENEKKNLERVFHAKKDLVDGTLISHPKLSLIKVNYNANRGRKDKKPGKLDEKILDILELATSYNKIRPTEVYNGIKTIEPLRLGMDKVHHFYMERVILIIANYLEAISNTDNYNEGQFLLGSVLPKMTKMNRYMPQYASKEKGFRALVGPMANALYFPPLSVENNFFS
jgi:DNA-directed RNA polymerase subunit RPC12/RpoP